MVTQGHSDLSLSHVCVVSAICTFIIMDKGEFFGLVCWHYGLGFDQLSICALIQSACFQLQPASQSQLLGKNPHIMMLHHCSNGFHVFHRETSVSDG